MSNHSMDISSIYERRRSNAQHELDQRVQALYAAYPALEELDYTIKLTGIAISKAALSGDAVALAASKEKLAALRQDKEDFLATHAIDKKALTIQYTCDVCKDTGFIGGETGSEHCACYRALVIANLYQDFTLDADRTMTFDRFSLDVYPNVADPARYGLDISPREKMQENYDICQHFVQHFGEPGLKNILIYGEAGVGKTFMCGCIANALLEKGIPVLYLSATEMFHIIAASRTGRADATGDMVMADLTRAELLIIDDLGTESRTDSRCAEFLEILNKRKALSGKRPCHTVISTNLNLKEIFSLYSERIGSRLLSEFDCCKFVGDDIRMI